MVFFQNYKEKKRPLSRFVSAPERSWTVTAIAGHPDSNRGVSTNSPQSAIQDIFDFFGL